VWAAARAAALRPEEAASPLARRPYDLRHAAVSTWLNGGVPAPQVGRGPDTAWMSCYACTPSASPARATQCAVGSGVWRVKDSNLRRLSRRIYSGDPPRRAHPPSPARTGRGRRIRAPVLPHICREHGSATAVKQPPRPSRSTGSRPPIRPPASPPAELHGFATPRKRLRSVPWPLRRVLAVLLRPLPGRAPPGRGRAAPVRRRGLRRAGRRRTRATLPPSVRRRSSSTHLVTGAAHLPGRPCGPDGTTAALPATPRRNDITG
jgi:hypothetical protein